MVARWKRESSIARTLNVRNPRSTCNRSQSHNGINNVLIIRGEDFISTRRKKDGRDRDIAEAVDKRCACPSGDHGLCDHLASVRRDSHVINRIQSVVAFIKDTDARHEDRVADSKYVTQGPILADGESGAARNAECNRLQVKSAVPYQVDGGQRYCGRDAEGTPSSKRVDFH